MELIAVKIIFEDPSYNYTTNVVASNTDSFIESYYVGKTLNRANYPAVNMQTCTGVEIERECVIRKYDGKSNS